MSACATCARGSHHQCTGLDGPITTHPDSLPRCTCHCNSPTHHKAQEDET